MQCDNTQKFQECFNNFTIFADTFLEIEHVQFMSHTCSLLLVLWVEIHQFGVVKTLRRFALLCNIFISYDVNNDYLISVTNKPFSTRKISYKFIFVLHKSLLHGFDYHFNCNQHVIFGLYLSWLGEHWQFKYFYFMIRWVKTYIICNYRCLIYALIFHSLTP